ncbi:hypothetical protein QF034_004855 [Streptomyces africanus]|uniref:Uncharacterized protein n=1 Tax=Streptomyces africanus TaxID=231024 RepID=A0ABU0QT88_9ACTN|nr:hypothetical protein [Streptomyces africanus]
MQAGFGVAVLAREGQRAQAAVTAGSEQQPGVTYRSAGSCW